MGYDGLWTSEPWDKKRQNSLHPCAESSSKSVYTFEPFLTCVRRVGFLRRLDLLKPWLDFFFATVVVDSTGDPLFDFCAVLSAVSASSLPALQTIDSRCLPDLTLGNSAPALDVAEQRDAPIWCIFEAWGKDPVLIKHGGVKADARERKITNANSTEIGEDRPMTIFQSVRRHFLGVFPQRVCGNLDNSTKVHALSLWWRPQLPSICTSLNSSQAWLR